MLFIFTSSAFSQHALFLKNGEQTRFRTLKQFESHIQIVTTDGKKVKIDTSDFIGYYDDQFQAMFFKKPVDPNNGGRPRFNYQIVEAVTLGKINLYRIANYYRDDPSGLSSGSRSVYYFAEKNNSYKTVYFYDIRNESYERGSTTLRSMIKDDTLTFQLMNDEHYIHRERDVVRLIKGYNLRNFKNPTINDQHPLGTISFYTRVDPEKSKDMAIRVNDSIAYKLIDKFPTPIKLPVFTFMKVCLVSGNDEVCDLLMANPFEITYYELAYSSMAKSFEIEKRSEAQVRSYMASCIQNKPR